MPLLTARMLHDDEPTFLLPQSTFSVLFLKAYLNAVRYSHEPPILLSADVEGPPETCLDKTFLVRVRAALSTAVRKGDLIGVLRSGVKIGRNPPTLSTGKSEPPVSQLEGAAGSPASDVEKTDEVRNLIALGKLKGFLTYEELTNALPPDMLSSEQIEHLMVIFGNLDIAVVHPGEGEAPPTFPGVGSSWLPKNAMGYFIFGVIVPHHREPAAMLVKRIHDQVAPLASTFGLQVRVHIAPTHPLDDPVVSAICRSEAGLLPEGAFRYFLDGECSNAIRRSSRFSLVVLKLDAQQEPADAVPLPDITGSLSGSVRVGDVLGKLERTKLGVYLRASEPQAALSRARSICKEIGSSSGTVIALRSVCFPDDASSIEGLLALATSE